LHTSPTSHEPAARPLSGAARLVLIATTAATIALFYLFICLSLLALLVWLGLFLLVVAGLARFGAAGLIIKFFERDVRLFGLVVRSLWLSEGATYRLPLQRADAPRLFAMVEGLAGRLAIPPPDELCLEMNCGAWVQLHGLKTGLGTTRIGVGYDLLAGLSEQEVEAVMAHELTHAKLISRALRNWLFAGLGRAATVSNQLSAVVDAHRRAGEGSGPGDLMLLGADALTRLCARQMGAYSRQNEFEADRGAAELCGSAAMRASLQRLEVLHPKLARLPWNERVAKIESPDGLSRWLQQELAAAGPAAEDGPAEVFDRYSTHPSLRDRLAALPADNSKLSESQSGLSLLAEPDNIVLKLVAAIQQTALKEEAKDLRELRKWLRKIRDTRSYRAAQLPGMLVIGGSIVCGAIALAMGMWVAAAACFLGLVPLGIWFWILGRYRDKRPLPVPDYEAFMKGRQDYPLPDLENREKKIEEELRQLIAGEPKKRRQAARLVDEGVAALGRVDYLRAHVASRLAQKLDPKSVECALVTLVAAGAFDQRDVVGGLMAAALKQTGLRSPSSAWAGAWALLLCGDWRAAEAFLHEAMKPRPDDPQLLALLAFCQSRRGKWQSALANIRRCCQPRPPTAQHHKLFVSLLLDHGALREAGRLLEQFGPAAAYDPDVVHLRIHFHLLRREFAHAEQQLAMLAESDLPGHRLLAIGYLYENARTDTKAVEFFQRALAQGHYPDALLALARHAAEARDKARAREYIHAALDTMKKAADKAASAYDVFHPALNQLLRLEEPVDSCRAWLARFLPGKDAGLLTKHALLVFAPTEQAVHAYVQTLLQAMKPGEPPLSGAYVQVQPAPRDLQPVRPVRPGIQYVYQ
jgi:heat shock protein HtpX